MARRVSKQGRSSSSKKTLIKTLAQRVFRAEDPRKQLRLEQSRLEKISRRLTAKELYMRPDKAAKWERAKNDPVYQKLWEKYKNLTQEKPDKRNQKWFEEIHKIMSTMDRMKDRDMKEDEYKRLAKEFDVSLER